MSRRYARSLVLLGGLAASPVHAQTLIPGSYLAPNLNQSADSSTLAISNAPLADIPMSAPYGDQGYTVNAWGNCNCVGNPALDNSDTLRIVGVNNGTGPSQVNGLSVYMLSNAPGASGIGQTTGVHVVGVANDSGPIWGFNSVLTDSPFMEGYTHEGNYLDNEYDFDIGSSQTTMTGLSIGGILLNSPSYGAAFTANFIGAGKIQEFAYAWDGCCNVALHAGLFAKPQAANAGSQPIQMDWTDQYNNKNSLYFTAFENTMVLTTSDKAVSNAAYATQQGAGITKNVTVSASCTLVISGGIIIGTQNGC